MVRATLLMLIIAAQMLVGCAAMKDLTKEITKEAIEGPPPSSKAAKEFATQKEAVCCFVGIKQLQDPAPPAPPATDYAAQIAALKAALAAKEAENAALKAALAAKESENAALKAALAAKEAENAELARKLAALKPKPVPFAQLLEREYFDSGSAKLKPEGVKKLKQLSADLKAKAGTDMDIRIEGHTDDRPIHTAQFPSNWELSSARANAVVRSLHDDGINGEQLLGVGYGDSRPAAPNTSAESRAKNRRVEIVLAPSLAAPVPPKQ